MPKLIVLKQEGLPKEKKDHVHDSKEEQFINRTDIKFQKCKVCGWKTYPDGVVQVFGGSHTEILWPT